MPEALQAEVLDFIGYLLEQQGCTVLASEYNDFPKPLDTHSYDACLKALEFADYFVLLIGSRVGGWYDKGKRISITQQEYRAAYQRHLEGKLKIVSLVRADVWRLREDRKELGAFLETLEIDPGGKEAIKNYPSKCATDAGLPPPAGSLGKCHRAIACYRYPSPRAAICVTETAPAIPYSRNECRA